MATILETFFTRLGFEVDESGLKNAQTKIAGLGKNILGLGIFSGLSLAGLVKLTQGTAEALGSIQRLSDRTGIATQTIAGMSKAGAGFNVTSEGVQSSLTNVNKALGGVIIQEPRAVALFKRLGLSATDAAGAQKDVVGFLGDVAEKIKTMPAGAQARVLDRLGIDPEMIGMLKNGRQEFLNLYQTAEKGVLFKPEDYKRSEEFVKAFNKVKGISKSIGQGIGLEIMKPLGDLIDKFNKWWASNGKKIMEEMRGRLKGWMDAFSVLGNIFSKFADKGHLVVRIMELFALAVAGLIALQVASWIGGIISKLGPWGIALLAIGALIWLIIDDFQTWKRGGESVIGYFEKKFPEAFGMVRDGVLAIRAAFSHLWEVMKNFWAQNGPQIITLTKQFLKFIGVVGSQLLIRALKYIGDSIEELAWLIEKLTPVFKAVMGVLANISTINAQKIKDTWREWGDEIKKDWNDAGAYIANNFKEWGAEIKSDLASAGSYIAENFRQWGAEIKSDWDDLSAAWNGLMGKLGTAWKGMTDTLRDLWQSFVGWLQPWIERIEKFFGFVTGKMGDSVKAMDSAATNALNTAGSKFMAKTKEMAKGALDWLPQKGAPQTFAELAGVPAAAAPASTITNAQRSQTTTQNNDVKATINVTAPDPATAAAMTAEKINDLAQFQTRYGQSFAK